MQEGPSVVTIRVGSSPHQADGEVGAPRRRASKVDGLRRTYGFDDVSLAPGPRTVEPADVDTSVDIAGITLRIPVLAVQGREDQYGTLAQIDEVENRSYAPVDTLILDECRHAPHLDQPEKVVAGIAEFCARLERIEAAEPEVA